MHIHEYTHTHARARAINLVKMVVENLWLIKGFARALDRTQGAKGYHGQNSCMCVCVCVCARACDRTQRAEGRHTTVCVMCVCVCVRVCPSVCICTHHAHTRTHTHTHTGVFGLGHDGDDTHAQKVIDNTSDKDIGAWFST
jgi:hypothetical protein